MARTRGESMFAPGGMLDFPMAEEMDIDEEEEMMRGGGDGDGDGMIFAGDHHGHQHGGGQHPSNVMLEPLDPEMSQRVQRLASDSMPELLGDLRSRIGSDAGLARTSSLATLTKKLPRAHKLTHFIEASNVRVHYVRATQPLYGVIDRERPFHPHHEDNSRGFTPLQPPTCLADHSLVTTSTIIKSPSPVPSPQHKHEKQQQRQDRMMLMHQEPGANLALTRVTSDMHLNGLNGPIIGRATGHLLFDKGHALFDEEQSIVSHQSRTSTGTKMTGMTGATADSRMSRKKRMQQMLTPHQRFENFFREKEGEKDDSKDIPRLDYHTKYEKLAFGMKVALQSMCTGTFLTIGKLTSVSTCHGHI